MNTKAESSSSRNAIIVSVFVAAVPSSWVALATDYDTSVVYCYAFLIFFSYFLIPATLVVAAFWRLRGKLLGHGMLAVIALSFIPLLAAVIAGRVFGPTIEAYVFPEDTNYSEGYSEVRFQAIVPGMSMESVISTLGVPIATDVRAGVDMLRYSERGTTYRSYHARAIRIENGVVASIVMEFRTSL